MEIQGVAHTRMQQASATSIGQSQAVAQDADSDHDGAQANAAATGDTVDISSAGKAALAANSALEEAKETPQQTAKEAMGGDRQAQRLLAKQQAGHIAV